MTGFVIVRDFGDRVELTGGSAAVFADYADARRNMLALSKKFPHQTFAVMQRVTTANHELQLVENVIGPVRDLVRVAKDWG